MNLSHPSCQEGSQSRSPNVCPSKRLLVFHSISCCAAFVFSLADECRTCIGWKRSISSKLIRDIVFAQQSSSKNPLCMCEGRDKSTLPLPSGEPLLAKDYGWISRLFRLSINLISHPIGHHHGGRSWNCWLRVGVDCLFRRHRRRKKCHENHPVPRTGMGRLLDDHLYGNHLHQTPSNIPSHPLTITFNPNSFSQSSMEYPVH